MASLKSLRIVDLKEICRSKGLPVSGSKQILIDRIQSSEVKIETAIENPKIEEPRSLM